MTHYLDIQMELENLYIWSYNDAWVVEITDEIFIENFQDNWPGFKQNNHDTSQIKKTLHNEIINYEKTFDDKKR